MWIKYTPKEEANHICFHQLHSIKRCEIVSLCFSQRTHNGSLLIPFLKRSFFTSSFSCRNLQEKWMYLGILFIFHNCFHTWWLLSNIYLRESSASRLAFKKWYELFREKVAMWGSTNSSIANFFLSIARWICVGCFTVIYLFCEEFMRFLKGKTWSRWLS